MMVGNPLSPPGWDERFRAAQNIHSQMAEMHRQIRGNPELVAYIGPGELLERFQTGAVVTSRDAILDESEWVARAIHSAQRRRLNYMLGIDR
jgi:hypothetical protein